MNEEFFFSKKGQRKLSAFVGQELIYDYFVGSLDEERRKAVEEFLKVNPEANRDFQKIRNGIDYVRDLSQIKVSEPLFEKISAPASYIQVLVQKARFDEWHPALRGGFEASVIAIGVALIAILIPWYRLMDIKVSEQDVILTEVSRHESRPQGSETEVATKEQETFPDEGPAAAEAAAIAAKTAAITTTTVLVVKPSTSTLPPTTVPKKAVATATTLPSLESLTAPAPTTNTETAAAAGAAVTTATAETAPVVEKAGKVEEAVGDPKLAGFLYRGTLIMVNPHAIAPKLSEKIVQLGGRKAGEVELGWIKGTGAYYHFTIPEGKYEELSNSLKEYGELKIQKERHGRTMPQGIIRLIITADEKK